MQKLPLKPLILIIIIVFAASSVNVQEVDETDQNVQDGMKSSVETDYGSESIFEDEALILEFSVFNFTLPNDWTIKEDLYIEDETEYMSFIIPDYEYEVTLTMKMESYEGDAYSLLTEYIGNNFSIFTEGCNAFACYVVADEKEGYENQVMIKFSIESNEEVPENLDGPWSPSTSLNREDLEIFMNTLTRKSK